MDYAVLDCYGIAYQNGIARCAGSEELYERLLRLFLEDKCYHRAKAAFDARDTKTLFYAVHEMKGACGNAGLIGLYEALCPMVEALRDKNSMPEEIYALFLAMENEYFKAVEGVSKAMEIY